MPRALSERRSFSGLVSAQFPRAVFSLLAGLFVFYQGGPKRTTQNTWFFALSFHQSLAFPWFFAGISNSSAVAEKAVYLIYAAAIFIPPFFLHFILSLLDEEKKQRVALVAAYGTGLVEVVLLIFGQLTEGVRGIKTRVYEVPTRPYVLHFLAFVIYPAMRYG
jgi:hypothetical protein